MENKKLPPAGPADGGEAATGNLPLPLEFTTEDANSQTLTLGRALRLRDAMITLERRMKEARIAFEADIAGILARGKGDD